MINVIINDVPEVCADKIKNMALVVISRHYKKTKDPEKSDDLKNSINDFCVANKMPKEYATKEDFEVALAEFESTILKKE